MKKIWPFRRHGRHDGRDQLQPVPPMIEKGSGWRVDEASSSDLAVYLKASDAALAIYHENRNDPRYQKPYRDAYHGLITYAEADQAVLTLAAHDQAKEKGNG